ncbi:actin-binding protein WASF2 [Halyomorpha halys]|uniref:actin-binding protein WASF2 n=1 Tax=Halyomorpha halys TaxID=286706 RepID=UPI0006D5026B|nr:Nance-Horan syndrome protein-like [Halyomorpha halys]
MPFVVRTVEPRNLGRTRLNDDTGRPLLRDGELEAVSNATLANALRQLASVARIAEEIFQELNSQLTEVSERSSRLKSRIGSVQEKVSQYDPKAVTVRK